MDMPDTLTIINENLLGLNSLVIMQNGFNAKRNTQTYAYHSDKAMNQAKEDLLDQVLTEYHKHGLSAEFINALKKELEDL